MIERERLEKFYKRQVEINKIQSKWNDEFGKYKDELTRKAIEVLKWKDENLAAKSLRYKWVSAIEIKAIRSNCLVLCVPDVDCELPTRYYNILFDEIFSDDWKEKALKVQEEKKQRKLEEEKAAKEKMLADIEEKERREYERLKLKFGER